MRTQIVPISLLSLVFAICMCPKLAASPSEKQAEQTCEIEVGPFDLHRKYRSMEGPWVAKDVRISDLLSEKTLSVPETQVQYVEGNPNHGPSMNSENKGSSPEAGGQTVANTNKKRELYWFTGLKLEVLDEHDRPLPNAEFICHLNIDVDPAFRHKVFPNSARNANPRVMTLTQGQTKFYFPAGYAVPVASDEVWHITFQAANRTTSEHRRIKHKLTMNFIKDSGATSKIKALSWFTPYITVIIAGATPAAMAQEHRGPSCLVSSAGLSAPNMAPGSQWRDRMGRVLSGHWVIPPGKSVWRSPILEDRDPGFADKDMVIHAVWTHMHPLCTSASLIDCSDNTRKSVFTANAQTKTSGGLQIMHIDNILSPKGISLAGKKYYELEATYENPTNENQDSMITCGIFVEDENFKRPLFQEVEIASLDNKNAGKANQSLYCGVKPVSGTSAVSSLPQAKANSATDIVPPYPVFDPATDGPLISDEKTIEVLTSAGKIHLVLDPKLAPKHATQLYRLFKAGAFDGTKIFRFEPNFVLQVDSADRKAEGRPAISPIVEGMLRRLPLEVEAQANGAVLHKKGTLSMAHYDQPDTAVSSFSIMLADAPHLNRKYTIFGHIVDDAVTRQTLDQIEKNWSFAHPYIIGMDEIKSPIASAKTK